MENIYKLVTVKLPLQQQIWKIRRQQKNKMKELVVIRKQDYIPSLINLIPSLPH